MDATGDNYISLCKTNISYFLSFVGHRCYLSFFSYKHFVGSALYM